MGNGEWGMGEGWQRIYPLLITHCSLPDQFDPLPITHYPFPIIRPLTPAVFVVKAHDVVFLDVVPGLHFDNHQRFASRIDQPVTVAGWDER